MQNAAFLISAIASLVTAVGGVVLATIGLSRSSGRERQRAARGAAARFLEPPSIDTSLIEAAIEEYFDPRPADEEEVGPND